jgi:hypothetical protein
MTDTKVSDQVGRQLLMSDLERANAELRAAVRIAAKRIKQLQFGRRNEDPILELLRRTWRGTRVPSARGV